MFRRFRIELAIGAVLALSTVCSSGIATQPSAAPTAAPSMPMRALDADLDFTPPPLPWSEQGEANESNAAVFVFKFGGSEEPFNQIVVHDASPMPENAPVDQVS